MSGGGGRPSGPVASRVWIGAAGDSEDAVVSQQQGGLVLSGTERDRKEERRPGLLLTMRRGKEASAQSCQGGNNSVQDRAAAWDGRGESRWPPFNYNACV